MAADSLDARIEVKFNWDAQDTLTGTDYAALSNISTIQKIQEIDTDASNNADGGGDQVLSQVISISASGNTTIDMTSFTNILQQTSQAFARVKQVLFRLLSTSDDATNGTNCSSITIGNAAANQLNLFMNVANSTITIPNGGYVAAGGNQTTGWIVNTSQRNVKIVNNDGSNAAAVQVTAFGGST